MTEKDKKQLEFEIRLIFQNVVNESNILYMVTDFIDKRYIKKPKKIKMEEIKKVLLETAKISVTEGLSIRIERVFEKEAKAVLKYLESKK